MRHDRQPHTSPDLSLWRRFGCPFSFFGVRANAANWVGHFLAKNQESRAPERWVAVGHHVAVRVEVMPLAA